MRAASAVGVCRNALDLFSLLTIAFPSSGNRFVMATSLWLRGGASVGSFQRTATLLSRHSTSAISTALESLKSKKAFPLSSLTTMRYACCLAAVCNSRTGRTHIDQAHVCIYTPRHWGAIALAPIHAHFPILVGSHL